LNVFEEVIRNERGNEAAKVREEIRTLLHPEKKSEKIGAWCSLRYPS